MFGTYYFIEKKSLCAHVSRGWEAQDAGIWWGYSLRILTWDGLHKVRKRDASPQVPSSPYKAISAISKGPTLMLSSNTKNLPRARSQQIPSTYGIPHEGNAFKSQHAVIRDINHHFLLTACFLSRDSKNMERSGTGHRNTQKVVSGSVRLSGSS